MAISKAKCGQVFGTEHGCSKHEDHCIQCELVQRGFDTDGPVVEVIDLWAKNSVIDSVHIAFRLGVSVEWVNEIVEECSDLILRREKQMMNGRRGGQKGAHGYKG